MISITLRNSITGHTKVIYPVTKVRLDAAAGVLVGEGPPEVELARQDDDGMWITRDSLGLRCGMFDLIHVETADIPMRPPAAQIGLGVTTDPPAAVTFKESRPAKSNADQVDDSMGLGKEV